METTFSPESEIGRALALCLPALLTHQRALWAVKDVVTGTYLHVNAEMAAFLQCAPNALQLLNDNEIFDAPVVLALRAAEQTALAQREPLVSDHRFEWAGKRHDFSVWRTVVQASAGGRRLLCSVWADQSATRIKDAQLRSALDQLEQQQRANDLLRRELKEQSQRDSASGLYTRAHFEDQLRREVDLSTREHREFALVLIDLDPPSEATLKLGEPGQARVLEAMGRLLRGNTRAMDASCRLGDVQFGVLLSGVGLATAHARMEGLRRQCATQIVMHDAQELGFTVSMGVASFPHSASTQPELVAACELAITEAKRRGGNQVTLASIKFDDADTQT